MENVRLLECLAADSSLLREAAAGADLAARVPSCPDWSMADLVRHVGAVYLNKVEAMRRGEMPHPWPPEGLNEEPPLALLDRAYAALAEEFTHRDPGQPAPTWLPTDQTVGFWIRRMAHETVIHRVDAELGAGVTPGPIPADLAEDGIDEVLFAFLEHGSRTWPDDFAPIVADPAARPIRVRASGLAWLVRPTPDGVFDVRGVDVGADGHPAPAEANGAAATVSGRPADLLLWLWNRGGDDTVEVTGDANAVALLRRALAVATS